MAQPNVKRQFELEAKKFVCTYIVCEQAMNYLLLKYYTLLKGGAFQVLLRIGILGDGGVGIGRD